MIVVPFIHHLSIINPHSTIILSCFVEKTGLPKALKRVSLLHIHSLLFAEVVTFLRESSRET